MAQIILELEDYQDIIDRLNTLEQKVFEEEETITDEENNEEEERII